MNNDESIFGQKLFIENANYRDFKNKFHVFEFNKFTSNIYIVLPKKKNSKEKRLKLCVFGIKTSIISFVYEYIYAFSVVHINISFLIKCFMAFNIYWIFFLYQYQIQ